MDTGPTNIIDNREYKDDLYDFAKQEKYEEFNHTNSLSREKYSEREFKRESNDSSTSQFVIHYNTEKAYKMHYSGVTTDVLMTKQRKKWLIISNLCTWFIPNCMLNKNIEIRQAWREKTTIFLFFILLSAGIVLIIHFMPKLLCPNTNLYSWKDIYSQKNEAWMIINGKVLDIKKYANIHPSPIKSFIKYAGQDVSYMFETIEYDKPNLKTFKIYTSLLNLFLEYKTNDTNRYCNNNFCHSYSTFNNNSTLIKGVLALSYDELLNNPDQNWFVLYNNVYNISEYVLYGHPIYPSKYDHETQPKQMAYYLDQRLNLTMLSRCGSDATGLFEEQFQLSEQIPIINYLNKFYYAGVLDIRYNILCIIVNNLYLAAVCIMAGILIIKFITSLFILHRQFPECVPKHVIINIPCYCENKESLEKTIHSIYNSIYPHDKKLLFIIADGLTKNKDTLTPEILLNIFDRSLNEETNEYYYNSIGEHDKKINKAKVFSGYYKTNKIELPYIIIVKTGLDIEISRQGNRGKRDSQLILLNFLNKHHYKKELGTLDQRIYDDIINLGLDITKYAYMLSIDADTYVRSDAIMQMVYHMKNPKIIALCGETLVRNKLDNWITAIQVYEYYLNHNLNKAFESLFSSVICLPGCFSMYRIYSGNMEKIPILIDDEMLKNYGDNNINTLHKKNLLQLGEDRFFTTLLTKHFPTGKLKFIIEAKCETTVPNTWSALLSQRRRWINSTLHNLFELLFMSRMCGVCCFSMKFIIFLDILTTLLLPVSCGYLLYLIYGFSTFTIKVPLSFTIFAVTLAGVQVLIFVIKRDFIFIIWLIIYTVAIPIWFIIIPVYAFAKMDDFSWSPSRVEDNPKGPSRVEDNPKGPSRVEDNPKGPSRVEDNPKDQLESKNGKMNKEQINKEQSNVIVNSDEIKNNSLFVGSLEFPLEPGLLDPIQLRKLTNSPSKSSLTYSPSRLVHSLKLQPIQYIEPTS
jgi:chitin synthase